MSGIESHRRAMAAQLLTLANQATEAVYLDEERGGVTEVRVSFTIPEIDVIAGLLLGEVPEDE